MKKTGKIFNFVLSLWAIAILWICIGTLVNFHQHKIWGKPLLPELLYAKRDKESSIDLAKILKPDLPGSVNTISFSPVDGFASCHLPGIHFSSYISYIKLRDCFPEARIITSSGLRAPPLS